MKIKSNLFLNEKTNLFHDQKNIHLSTCNLLQNYSNYK